MASAGTVAEIWRYPVKSMGGERARAVGHRRRAACTPTGCGPCATWSSTRSPPRVAGRFSCSAAPGSREDPAGPLGRARGRARGHRHLPGRQRSSPAPIPAIHDRLSELIGKPARLESLPALSEKRRYRTPQATKADLRRQFAIPDGEPLPDFSMFPVRKLAELARYATPVGALYDAYPILVMTRASLRAMAERAPGLAVRRPPLQAQRADRPRRRRARGVRLVRRPAPRTACHLRRRHPHAALLDPDAPAGRPASRPRRPADHQRSR